VRFSLNLLWDVMLDRGAHVRGWQPGRWCDVWPTPCGSPLPKICWTRPMFEPQTTRAFFGLGPPVSTFQGNWCAGAFAAP